MKFISTVNAKLWKEYQDAINTGDRESEIFLHEAVQKEELRLSYICSKTEVFAELIQVGTFPLDINLSFSKDLIGKIFDMYLDEDEEVRVIKIGKNIFSCYDIFNKPVRAKKVKILIPPIFKGTDLFSFPIVQTIE